jgi:hypothetical protein
VPIKQLPQGGCSERLELAVTIKRLQLTAHNMDLLRGFDPQTDPLPDDPLDNQDDSIANHNSITHFSA